MSKFKNFEFTAPLFFYLESQMHLCPRVYYSVVETVFNIILCTLLLNFNFSHTIYP